MFDTMRGLICLQSQQAKKKQNRNIVKEMLASND